MWGPHETPVVRGGEPASRLLTRQMVSRNLCKARELSLPCHLCLDKNAGEMANFNSLEHFCCHNIASAVFEDNFLDLTLHKSGYKQPLQEVQVKPWWFKVRGDQPASKPLLGQSINRNNWYLIPKNILAVTAIQVISSERMPHTLSYTNLVTSSLCKRPRWSSNSAKWGVVHWLWGLCISQ